MGRHKYFIIKYKNMKQHFIVIFEQPVVLPGDKMERITTYGLYLPKSHRTTFENIEAYLIYYIKTLDLVFGDEKVEVCNRNFFKKDGQLFAIDDDVWDQYAAKAEKARMKFAVLDDADVEITDDDRFDMLLTNKEKWEQLKIRKDVVWRPKVDVQNNLIK